MDSNESTGQLGKQQTSPTYHVANIDSEVTPWLLFHQQPHASQSHKIKPHETLQWYGQLLQMLKQTGKSHGPLAICNIFKQVEPANGLLVK